MKVFDGVPEPECLNWDLLDFWNEWEIEYLKIKEESSAMKTLLLSYKSFHPIVPFKHPSSDLCKLLAN
jgi:uncharacterized protein YktA (UPF0223 family)